MENTQSAHFLNNSSSSVLLSSDINKAVPPFNVVGTYDVRGSRTVYFGQANKDGSNVYLHLDYKAEKNIHSSPDNKALTCSYGDSKYVSQGWKYIIRYNKSKNEITLAPNDVMAAAIVPNSFETREATYNSHSKVFSFRTRFTSPEDGNEAEIFEVLTAQ